MPGINCHVILIHFTLYGIETYHTPYILSSLLLCSLHSFQSLPLLPHSRMNIYFHVYILELVSWSFKTAGTVQYLSSNVLISDGNKGRLSSSGSQVIARTLNFSQIFTNSSSFVVAPSKASCSFGTQSTTTLFSHSFGLITSKNFFMCGDHLWLFLDLCL